MSKQLYTLCMHICVCDLLSKNLSKAKSCAILQWVAKLLA